jgi:hypothetical protein
MSLNRQVIRRFGRTGGLYKYCIPGTSTSRGGATVVVVVVAYATRYYDDVLLLDAFDTVYIVYAELYLVPVVIVFPYEISARIHQSTPALQYATIT